MRITRRSFGALALSAAIVTCAAPAMAQPIPDGIISIVVGGGAGGGADTIARLFAHKLSDQLGRQVIVENRVGAGAALAVEYVANAEPNGLTILLTASGSIAVRPAMTTVPYDARTDLSPVSMVLSAPYGLIINNDVPATNVEELIAYLKENGSNVNYASSGIGTTNHLAGEYFKVAAGVDMVHVPYGGGSQEILQSLIAGETQVSFDTLYTALPHIDAGSIRVVGVSTEEPVSLAPDLPPIGDALDGFGIVPWYALFLPEGASQELVDFLHAETLAVLGDPEFIATMENLGNVVESSTPQELADKLAADIELFADVVEQAGIPFEP